MDKASACFIFRIIAVTEQPSNTAFTTGCMRARCEMIQVETQCDSMRSDVTLRRRCEKFGQKKRRNRNGCSEVLCRLVDARSMTTYLYSVNCSNSKYMTRSDATML